MLEIILGVSINVMSELYLVGYPRWQVRGTECTECGMGK